MILFSVLQKAGCIDHLVGEWEAKLALAVQTDSRKIKPVEAGAKQEERALFFIPLKGENFDGHQFIPAFLASGHRCFAVELAHEKALAAWQKDYPDLKAVVVTDTLKFLQEIAALRVQAWRQKNPAGKIMGITGSNGKTTHKEMIAFLLEGILPEEVHYSQGNLNNHIGVPLTLLGLEDNHQVVLGEMGINHPGEMTPLCQMADPECALITNIGATHLEFMGSEAGVWEEKSNLFRYVLRRAGLKPNPGAFVLMGGEAHWMASLPASPVKQIVVQEILTAPDGEGSEVAAAGDYVLQIRGHGGQLTTPQKTWYWQNKNIAGSHNQANLGRALLAAALLVGDQHQEALEKRAADFKASFNRSSWLKIADKSFYLDAYNANPSSMQTALQSFVQQMREEGVNPRQCCVVLGDMNELGPTSGQKHEQIGQLLRQLEVKNAIFVGRYAQHYAQGFAKNATIFATREDLLTQWPQIWPQYTYFFIKASRSLQLERLTDITS